uniref:Uncharacterized protein n=1 Tax=Oryza punctata TaxID=4537 RepID=A0A0E0JIA6_ORYPU
MQRSLELDGYSLTKLVAGEDHFSDVGGRSDTSVSLLPVLLSRPADDGGVHVTFACTLLDKSGKPTSPESKGTTDSLSGVFDSGTVEEAWPAIYLIREAVESLDDRFVVRFTVSTLKKRWLARLCSYARC